MASIVLGVCLLFFSVVLTEASMDGICNVTETTGETKLVRKWKYVNGRRKTYMDYEPVKNNLYECCKGYQQEDQNSTSIIITEPIVCIPQCEPPCMDGVCVEPNKCNCVPGYEFRNGTCQSICFEPCNNGTCVEPETCKCLFGYRMTDINICSPVCSTGCGNGTCISPEVCHCNDGFTLTNGTCEPKCWPPCETGDCIAPDTCSCGPGYERIQSNVTTCEPICSPECGNGVCVGPNICMCDKGYALQNGSCKSLCRLPCVNGTCESPYICKCFEGYKKRDYDASVCVPECPGRCAFGTCVAPGDCRCREGFALTNGTCLPACSPPCGNGTCTIALTCHCNYGYYRDRLTGTCQPESKWHLNFGENTTMEMVPYGTDWPTPTIQRDEGTTWLTPIASTFSTTSRSLPIAEKKRSPVSWMCYVIPVLVLLMFVLIILVWKRHYIGEFCVGRVYVVSEGEKCTASKNNIPSMTYSAIEERQARRERRNLKTQ